MKSTKESPVKSLLVALALLSLPVPAPTPSPEPTCGQSWCNEDHTHCEVWVCPNPEQGEEVLP